MEAGSDNKVKDLKKISKAQADMIKNHQATIKSLVQKIKDINQEFDKLQNFQNSLRKNILSMKRVSSVIEEQKKLTNKTAGLGKEVNEMKKSDYKVKNGLKKLHKWDKKLWKGVKNINKILKGTTLVSILTKK